MKEKKPKKKGLKDTSPMAIPLTFDGLVGPTLQNLFNECTVSALCIPPELQDAYGIVSDRLNEVGEWEATTSTSRLAMARDMVAGSVLVIHCCRCGNCTPEIYSMEPS